MMTMTPNTPQEVVREILPGIPLNDPYLNINWDEIKAEPKCIQHKVSFITTIVCGKICKAMEWNKVEAREWDKVESRPPIRPPILNVSLFFQIMKRQENDDLKMLSRCAYLLHIDEYPESFEQLSNELLQCSFACMADVKSLGMIKSESLEGFSVNPSYHYQFLHPIIQEYFAAYYLINQPLMTVMKFVNSKLFSLDQNKWGVLEMYFGLAGAGLSKIAKEALFYMISYICQSFNGSHPIISNQKALLIMRCLNEAQDNNLCLQVHHELFRSQIFSFSIDEIESSINGVAYYLVSSAQDDATWKVYCSKERLVSRLKLRIDKCTDIRKRKIPVVVVREDHDLMFGDLNRIVISLRSRDYVFTTLSEHISYGTHDTHFDSQAIEVTSESSVIVTADRVTRPSMPVVSADPSELSLGAYGHQTTEQYRTRRQVENVTFYNMVKDLVAPQLQMYCPILVQSQYRKSDHIWFSFSRNMRYDFYEGVLITPIVPMHWVKVSQPNGSIELEEKYKTISIQSHTSSSSQVEIAELVLLNSSRYVRIGITPPTGEDPIIISLYANSDECNEPGEIGCDYLDEKYEIKEDIRWRNFKTFQEGEDEQVVRELPLPSNRETESGVMTTNTAVANITTMESMPVSSPPPSMMSSQYGKVLGTFGTSLVKPLHEGRQAFITEQQIKRYALEGFDQPGYCFYGDGEVFVIGHDYTLPDKKTTGVIREGGNGLILEVFFEGTVYAVKRTAFRWREVLIMPKLHHPNILPLIAMLMGDPIEAFPRRRYIYHYYPRMTNDLGRTVGSYERFCLRSLNERYKNEPLLLRKIQNNFRYIAREILQGLHYLHTLPNPIIHRDIKPSNILVLTDCECPNPLACVCRKRPKIMLSDFDASLELNPDGSLQPDPPKSSSKDIYTTTDRTYHISPVGTMGFKSPEGYIHMVSNNADLMTSLSTKADIFSFGLLMCLLTLNEEGPKHLSQVGTLLLSAKQAIKTSQPLDQRKQAILEKHGITTYRRTEPCVVESDIHKILPIVRLRRAFVGTSLIDFVEKCLVVDSDKRPTANELLKHDYISGFQY